MKKSVLFFVLLVAGCGALPAGETVTLTNSEVAQVHKLAEAQQDLGMRRQKLQADFNAANNRLNEEEAEIDLKGKALCFEFMKAHKLPPNANYQIDVWSGKLVRKP